ncbi:hypothetical protein J2T12_002393 [Paenibacillus anaericanus]|nr:hypothetical protein [Paenibacillus anaericanus]
MLLSLNAAIAIILATNAMKNTQIIVSSVGQKISSTN